MSYFLKGKGTGVFEQCYYGPQKQFRVTKLSPASRYSFRLAAKNDMGVRYAHPDAGIFPEGTLAVVRFYVIFLPFNCLHLYVHLHVSLCLCCVFPSILSRPVSLCPPQRVQWSGGPVHLMQCAIATLPSRAGDGGSDLAVSEVAEAQRLPERRWHLLRFRDGGRRLGMSLIPATNQFWSNIVQIIPIFCEMFLLSTVFCHSSLTLLTLIYSLHAWKV